MRCPTRHPVPQAIKPNSSFPLHKLLLVGTIDGIAEIISVARENAISLRNRNEIALTPSSLHRPVRAAAEIPFVLPTLRARAPFRIGPSHPSLRSSIKTAQRNSSYRH